MEQRAKQRGVLRQRRIGAADEHIQNVAQEHGEHRALQRTEHTAEDLVDRMHARQREQRHHQADDHLKDDPEQCKDDDRHDHRQQKNTKLAHRLFDRLRDAVRLRRREHQPALNRLRRHAKELAQALQHALKAVGQCLQAGFCGKLLTVLRNGGLQAFEHGLVKKRVVDSLCDNRRQKV